MSSNIIKSRLITSGLAASVLLLASGASFAQQQVNLTAGPATATLPDGSSVPMWGYSCGAPVIGSTATCAWLNHAVNPSDIPTPWSPVLITVPTGQSLQINLTNGLPVPTSLVIVGQLGGGLGTQRTTTLSPVHDNQPTSWPIANAGPVFQPPAPQGPRVQSLATEVAPGAATPTSCPPPGTGCLIWTAPGPGTYLIESGT